MTKKLSFLLLIFLFPLASFADKISYAVNGSPYEGYYVSPAKNAPLILLVHDWGGLTEYEEKRAHMLAKRVMRFLLSIFLVPGFVLQI